MCTRFLGCPKFDEGRPNKQMQEADSQVESAA